MVARHRRTQLELFNREAVILFWTRGHPCLSTGTIDEHGTRKALFMDRQENVLRCCSTVQGRILTHVDPFLSKIFQAHVADQARTALHGRSLIDHALPRNDHDHLWIGVQTFITGAGNLAKLFWGQAGRHTVARTALRESLAVEDDSPLKGVTLRNHFEHYDERIDRWWVESENHMYLDRHTGDLDSVNGFTDVEKFRVFDPIKDAVFFWGRQYDLRPLTEEIKRVLARAET